MATSNGHDTTTAHMVEILERIEGRIERIDARMDQTNVRLDQTNQRIDRLREELTGRIDHLIEITGASHRDHEVRIAKLEADRV